MIVSEPALLHRVRFVSVLWLCSFLDPSTLCPFLTVQVSRGSSAICMGLMAADFPFARGILLGPTEAKQLQR